MPDTENPWLDPRTLIAIGGLSIGILGFLFGIFRDRWSRRESRLEALGKILQPLVRAGQDLMRANTARRTIEQIKHSFPQPTKSVLEGLENEQPQPTPDAVAYANQLMEKYGEHLSSSEKNFRDAESEFATRHFRFPTKIGKQIKELQQTLSEMGRLTNHGFFDKADLELAKFRDQYKLITDTAKGWRLADPFEGILRRFRKSEGGVEERPSEHDLTQKEMDGVLELIHKRATTEARNTFAIHPPQKILDAPEIIESETVIDDLKDSIFSVVFQDGTAKMFSLPELMAFIFNLIVLAHETQQLNRMVAAAPPAQPANFNVSFQFSMQQIMTTEMVKELLKKCHFADTPSDGVKNGE